ncbi:hypothetical protein BDW22DRAFT_1363309 [Trametopsis cervina]|nr:hypothetical protein BDW22DRAFT_1363309 [Trametopsis cervina]
MVNQPPHEREDVPRIAVDTLHDWERIKASYTEAAMQELEDSMKKEKKDEHSKEVLRAHLRGFIERTFDMAKKNLRVNGRNFEEMDEDEQGGMEPFDEALDRHIWSLSDQSLQWDGEISRKRREKPMEVERLVRELVESRREVDDEEQEEFTKDTERLREGIDETQGGDGVDVGEEVLDVSRRTFAIVDELQQSVQLQQERSERLKTVTKEVKSLKP